jgi:hypothetical protein
MTSSFGLASPPMEPIPSPQEHSFMT